MGEIPHGTPRGYTYHGCRCPECRGARNAYRSQRRAAYYASEPTPEQVKECSWCGGVARRGFEESPARWAAHKYCSDECKCRAAIAARHQGDPHAIGSRTLVARTCVRCGQLKDADKFARDMRDGSHGRKCWACRGRDSFDALPEGRKSTLRASRNKRIKRINSESQEHAARSGWQWTGAELELVATRTDLPVRELAKMLGRSYAAVVHQRQLLGIDPRKSNAAGI